MEFMSDNMFLCQSIFHVLVCCLSSHQHTMCFLDLVQCRDEFDAAYGVDPLEIPVLNRCLKCKALFMQDFKCFGYPVVVVVVVYRLFVLSHSALPYSEVSDW